MQASYLTEFVIWLENDGGVFSCNVLEAAPALAKLSVTSDFPILLGAAALQYITAALHHGALQNLQTLSLWNCTVGDDGR